jgi:hypothetical protein
LLGLDDDDGTARSQGPIERVGDLCGESLLELRPAGEALDQVHYLREPNDALLWNVRDVGPAHEGEQVMLAHARKRQVPQQDRVVAVCFERDLQVVGRVFVQAREEVGVCLGDALGGLDQALPPRVLADSVQDLTHRPFDAWSIYAPLFGHPSSPRSIHTSPRSTSMNTARSAS